MLFYIIIVFSIIPSLVGLKDQRQPAYIAGVADSLSDWLVVSLPYSGVYCVNAGLGAYQINRTNSVKVEHTARDGNPLVL